MKRMRSHFYCLLLCLALLAVLLPGALSLTADASEIVDSGTCGWNLTWTLDDEGTLTISGTGDMGIYNRYHNEDYGWYSSAPWGRPPVRDMVQTVVIEPGVTSIARHAFDLCGNLSQVMIPDGITDIGMYAFYGCGSLTSIAIPDSVTAIGQRCFMGCSSLTRITIPDGVTAIGEYTFSGCGSLTSIAIPDGVTAIENDAFKGCGSLTSITIPDGVTVIGYETFRDCDSLTSITIPSSVTSIWSRAFFYCDSLTSVTIPDGVAEIRESAFSGCSSLTSIAIPGSVTAIGDKAFYRCLGLTSVSFSEGVESIGDSSFWNCDLKTLTLPASVTCIGAGAFASNDGLEEIHFLGDAPDVLDDPYTKYDEEIFDMVATAYYPGNNSTWTADVMQNYGSGLTWYEEGTHVRLNAPVAKITGNADTGKPKVYWEAVPHATLYRVYRATSKSGTYSRVKSTSSRSYTDTTARAGKNYYYKVVAVNTDTDMTSAYSNIVNRVCDLAKPVVTLKADTASGKPKLSWDAVSGAAKYRIYRADSKSGKYELIKTTTSRSYIDTTAEAGRNCYYKVKAVHTKSSADSAYSEIVNRVCDLAKPVVSITRTKSGDPRITWKEVEGAEKYYVYRATSKDGTYTKVKTTVSSRSYTDTSAKAGKTYYYKVKAIHSITAANSAYSSVKYITAK